MKQTIRILLLLFLILAACEPLAPDTNQQEVIVITNTPTLTPIPTATPPFDNTIPTRQPPTITPIPPATIIPTPTIQPCTQSEGTLFESTFSSTIEGELIDYNIYLPPCFFESGRRYPYVILFHGSGYTYQQWKNIGIQAIMDEGISNKSLAPMVVVMPEGGAKQENNYFDDGSYEDIILDELIPHLEENFCVQTTREGRAIGGVSRGGFWAMSIALRNPTMFAAVGGHSAFFVPDNAPASHNPLALAESAVGIEGLRIYLDTSQSYIGGPNISVFSNSLRDRGIPNEYVINPLGNHDNEYWSAHAPEYMAFFGQNWSKELAGLPSCQE